MKNFKKSISRWRKRCENFQTRTLFFWDLVLEWYM